jgi:putative SOS response-associated peptidase YedK
MRWGIVGDAAASEIQLRPLTSLWAETVRDQVDWRRILNSQRCLVPVDQFFEWQRVGDKKTREFGFKLRSGKPMMIAGLWNRTSSIGLSFAYISCPANELTSLVHDRMPVILDQSAIAPWFNPESSIGSLLSLLKPIKQNSLEVRPIVSTQPNHRPNQQSLFDRYAA